MNGFSTVDGFVEISESVAEMIKYVANEPSVGLYYVQQHVRNAAPNVVDLNNHVVGKSRETTLHAEDLEDSIAMVSSMKECGFPIADEMIKDIKSSLKLMSEKQPKRGLIHSTASSFQMRTSSWGPMSWGHGSGNVQQDGSNYFSTVIKSAKEKASNFKWPQLESKEGIQDEAQKPVSHPTPPVSVASASTSSILDTEGDDLPLSSQTADELPDEEGEKVETEDDAKLSHQNVPFMLEDYDDFKADKETKLEQWLDGNEYKMDKSKGESETGGL
ncbi:hypothetical protein PTKIN_Ptkin16aG0103500 [Pterospermum kingtungense]